MVVRDFGVLRSDTRKVTVVALRMYNLPHVMLYYMSEKVFPSEAFS